MMNDRHPSPDYSREEKQPGGDSSHPKGVIRPGSAQSGHGQPPSSMGPPPSYTTVTMTTDNTPGARVTEINLNIGYYKSLPGIVKIVQMIFGIISMACASPAARYYDRNGNPVKLNDSVGHNHWFLFVIVTCFILTFLWSCFYFLQLKDSINMKLPFSWLKLELYYTFVATILYVLAWIVLLAGFGYCAGDGLCDARIAAGVFAIFNTVAYGLGAFILLNDYKSTPPELQ